MTLWTSGRTLLHGAHEYMRQSAPRRSFHGWVDARWVVYEPPILIRTLTSAVTGLVAVFGISAAAFGPTQGQPAFAAAMFLVGVVSALASLAQIGGTMRISSILGERDPLWVRIRGWFTRV